MIDLSKVKGLADDVKGAITQIADAAGNVIWKAAPAEATITLTFFKNSLSSQYNMTAVIIYGVSYPIAVSYNNPDMTTKVLSVPIGTVITCKILRGGTDLAKITLNGETVVSGVGEYEYTVVGDATIHSTGTMSGPTAEHGVINITEA